MSRTDPLQDLDLLLRSRYSIVVLDTSEEDRAESLLKHLAGQLDLPLFAWTPSKGLRRADKEAGIYNTAEPGQALDHIESARFPAIYLFKGFEPYLADTLLARKLRDAAEPYGELAGAIILTGADLDLPEPVRQIAAVVQLPPPDVEEYRALLQHILRDLNRRGHVTLDQTPDETQRLLQNLRGLTLLEALLREVAATRPLSRTMAEKVEGLRAWAEGRTVRAN